MGGWDPKKVMCAFLLTFMTIKDHIEKDASSSQFCN